MKKKLSVLVTVKLKVKQNVRVRHKNKHHQHSIVVGEENDNDENQQYTTISRGPSSVTITLGFAVTFKVHPTNARELATRVFNSMNTAA